MYDDLGVSATQRKSLDSLFDDSNCQLEVIFRPIHPALDSVKTARRAQMNAILTPEQRTRLEARRKDDDARRRGTQAHQVGV